MEFSLDTLRRWQHWQDIEPHLHAAQSELSTIDPDLPALVSSADSWECIGKSLACIQEDRPLFLIEPNLPQAAYDKLLTQICPQEKRPEHRGVICIATSGTHSGTPRFAMHRWEHFTQAAKAAITLFPEGKPHTHCSLPLHHISGWMQWIRAWLADGEILFGKAGTTHIRPGSNITSLVPTQLHQLLKSGHSEWLEAMGLIFLGGAPAHPELLEQAQRLDLKIAPCYGSTETAAMVAVQMPSQTSTHILPHAKVSIHEGYITIHAPSLFAGYFPDLPEKQDHWQSSDLGQIDSNGKLKILGRSDAIIITGGKKVDPQEVADAIETIEGIEAAAVLGLADPKWGQRVLAFYEGHPLPPESIKAQLSLKLPSYKIPKDFIWLEELPRTALGKIAVSDLQSLINSP